jgi:hypothetical protein
MSTTLTFPTDLTLNRLTSLLYEDGLLLCGSIASIQHEPVAGEFGKSHLLYREMEGLL